jgi:hypothetical protein
VCAESNYLKTGGKKETKFINTNKIDKPLATPMRNKGEKLQIANIRNEL